MDVGIGLPNPIPGTPGRLLVDWARRAEEQGFSTLATVDRIAYPSYESLITLAAAAAATDRIRLLTNILVAPTRQVSLLAKQAASIDQLSGGRLTLGLAVGHRAEDYRTSDQPYTDRGRRFDAMLETLRAAWAGQPIAGSSEPIGPSPVSADGIPLLIGGGVERTIERVVAWGAGWTAPGRMSPDQVRPFAEQVRAAWREAGRDGAPRITALTYYALGDEAHDDSVAYLRDYYAYAGDAAHQVTLGIPRGADAIRDAVATYEQAGVDELILDPTVAELSQIDRLAAIL